MERISNQFGGLELQSKEINGAHNYFFIDVPPGVDSMALLKALRAWQDVKEADGKRCTDDLPPTILDFQAVWLLQAV